MSVRRATALAVALCLIAVGALALPWFAADVSGRRLTASGPEASPFAWAIVPAAVVVVALVIRAARSGQLTSPGAWRSLQVAAAAAAFGCVDALLITLVPDVVMRARSVADAPAVGLHRLGTGFVVAGAMAGVAALLLSWMIGIANSVDDRADAVRR